MPLPWKPEDRPAAVCFRLEEKNGGLEVTCKLISQTKKAPYRIEGGEPQFENRDSFKSKAVCIGMTPAVAEDTSRSFNATARQLRELGFDVELEKDAA